MATRDMVKTIRVNDENVFFEQNTVMINYGLGNKNRKSYAKGDGQTELVQAVDVSTKISSLKFAMPNDQKSREQAIGWAKNTVNTVQITFESGEIALMSNATIDSPDIGGGADTDIDIDFQGEEIK